VAPSLLTASLKSCVVIERRMYAVANNRVSHNILMGRVAKRVSGRRVLTLIGSI
jgi:hypothetical protein